MARRLLATLALGLLAGVSARSQTVVTVNFDDLVALTQPLEQYAGRGLHFSTGSYGIIAGNSNGNPGGWDLEGTASPHFLGFNGNPGYSQTVTLDFTAATVELDVARSAGSAAGDTFTLTVFNGTTSVGSQTVTLGLVNTWTTVSVSAASITKFTLSGAGLGFHPYGVDNLKITAVPEPTTAGLLAGGLLFLVFRRRRPPRRP